MSDYKQLDVWKKAHAVTMDIYALTKTFPAEERFGLVTQDATSRSLHRRQPCRRGRRGDPEFSRFIRIALGSAYELQYELLVSVDAGYISRDKFSKLDSELERIGRMLWALLERVQKSAAAAV